MDGLPQTYVSFLQLCHYLLKHLAHISFKPLELSLQATLAFQSTPLPVWQTHQLDLLSYLRGRLAQPLQENTSTLRRQGLCLTKQLLLALRYGPISSAFASKDLHWQEHKALVLHLWHNALHNYERQLSDPFAFSSVYVRFKDDVQWARIILQYALNQAKAHVQRISACLQNWTLVRLQLIDLMAMRAALSEQTCFAQTPRNIILSEYASIAHLYSGAKSANFVNGLLENLLEEDEKETIFA